MTVRPRKYIPAGCLVVSQEESNLPLELWIGKEFHRWRALSHAGHTASDGCCNNDALPPDIHSMLLKSQSLSRYSPLFDERWISLEFTINPDHPDSGVVRVYVLPDDVDRRLIARSEPKLRKARRELFSALDFSKGTWDGKPSTSRVSSPQPHEQDDGADDPDVSLLQLFNSIPSPDPTPDIVKNPTDQYAMYNLLASDVYGLNTSLYPYQCRSAAMMVQRESQPGQVVDPRLLHALDQDGESWYYDPNAGVVLREPRYYDGVTGGILAEQMGAGKTLICLAVILATRYLPTRAPDIYGDRDRPVRKKVGSLADMAAACATRNSLAWRAYFDGYQAELGYEFTNCLNAIARNAGFYHLPAAEPRRRGRHQPIQPPPKKIHLSNTTLIIVPNNLVQQWKQEVRKHTAGLKVLTLITKQEIPPVSELLGHDIVLISQSRFENIAKGTGMAESPLSEVHYKRCIVDEGHKLGHSKIGNKSNLLLGLEALQVSSRWIVTGTPSQGLYGVEDGNVTEGSIDSESAPNGTPLPAEKGKSSSEQEKGDIERIGAIAALYLKARPWANTMEETGDTPADWAVYVMQPKHSSRSSGRKSSLAVTLNSLMIRHRLSEITKLLPTVDEKVIVLDGSYQDKLSLNLFNMMIIFNAVQSQRADMDYFFHPRQRKALFELVHNLKQASFFGGTFFSANEITKSVETAEKFLNEKKIPISGQDEALLKEAIALAHTALENPLKNLSNQLNEMPIYVQNFLPGGAAQAWSVDGKEGNPVCTDASLIMAVQKLIRSSLGSSTSLNSLLNGKLEEEGKLRKAEQQSTLPLSAPNSRAIVLAGNTKLGDNRSPRNLRSNALHTSLGNKETTKPAREYQVPESLSRAQVLSTVSAKLSYLIDEIVKHQEDEQIIIFYENENVAWYLASMLDVIQLPYLIYARSLTHQRKSQYINTFNQDPKFRVLLMDITQAAFGLDMRAASRIYFINPVLNPQIQAQAIGRVRRISQQKPVTVETLVLRDSIEEVIVERKKTMTQAEHWNCKSILDDRPIYNWILNAKIIPLPEGVKDGPSQMIPLQHPQFVFGRGFGREYHPDEGLLVEELARSESPEQPKYTAVPVLPNVSKRPYELGPGIAQPETSPNPQEIPERPARRVRFAGGSDSE